MRQYLFSRIPMFLVFSQSWSFVQALEFTRKFDEPVPVCAPSPEPDLLNTEPSPLITTVETKLAEEGGVTGWIHSAVNEYGLYVFTYRGKNFFQSVELPLLAANPTVAAQLKMLSRHFKVRLFGKLLKKMPIEHVLVEKLELISTVEANLETNSINANISLDFGVPQIAKVHATLPGRGAIVVDIQNRIFPVVGDSALHESFNKLYRGDIVKLVATPGGNPDNPTHLMISSEQAKAFQVVDRMINCHEMTGFLVGRVVKFAKSPQISIDVFALRHVDAFGVEREWTLISEDDKVFEGLREKVAAVWDEHLATAVKDRNKMSNPKLQIAVSGKFNVVSPFQANPQVVISDLSDLVVSVVP